MAMTPKYLTQIQSVINNGPVSTLDRQMSPRALYKTEPDAAWIFDHATTTDAEVPADHPIHSHVVCGQGVLVDIPVCVHKAVGGESDFPNPGDILAAALASCFDLVIRMIANLKGIHLTHLKVHVSFGVDVRGTLMTGENVPVGFQTADIKVELKTGYAVPEAQLNALLDAAESSCVILQTLRTPPTFKIERFLNGETMSEAR
jgi:uncharacterized OsmC-like protein